MKRAARLVHFLTVVYRAYWHFLAQPNIWPPTYFLTPLGEWGQAAFYTFR